jgi:AraC-like DNA-binding protein
MFNNLYVRIFMLRRYLVQPRQWKLHEPKTTHWRLYWHEDDGVILRCGDTDVSAEAGRLYFVPAQIEFRADSTREVRQLFVHFDVIGLNRPLQQLAFARPMVLPETLRDECEQLERLLPPPAGETDGDLAQSCRAQSLIYRGLAACLEALSPEVRAQSEGLSADMAPITPALDFIEAHLAQPLRVGELARCCLMSESLFLRRFRESIGQTPVAYILERRIQRACQLLLFSEQSMETIANTVGFGDRHYFSRQFSRHIGVSPGNYRQMKRL